MQHVIIGAGPAGVIAAETLRQADPEAGITIIGNEPEPPYSRMALPYFLNNRIDESGTYLRKSDNYFEGNDIAIIRDKVTSLDPDGQRVVTEKNGNITFDRALIATGSQPLIPRVPGNDGDGIYPCWTLADARNIAARAQPGSDVVLIGAGFIGCIIMEALVSRGVKLAVVEMADHMVPRMMDQAAAGMLEAWCRDKGITIHTSAALESITTDRGKSSVKLETGNSLAADLVIFATGVRSNTRFLNGSGLEIDSGVLVNDYLQTNAAHIYAAGDVCQGRDFSTGAYSVQAIQPTAADQGRLAALNMCGRQITHRGCVNMNVLDTLGLVTASYGLWQCIDGNDSVELLDADRYRYINLQFQDDVLVGAQTVGLTQHIGVIRGLIETRLNLGNWKQHLMADPTRIMEAYIGATQPIGHNDGIIR